MQVWRHAEVGYVRNRTLEGQRRGITPECPRGARTALKNYSDNEAVRCRGLGLVSTENVFLNLIFRCRFFVGLVGLVLSRSTASILFILYYVFLPASPAKIGTSRTREKLFPFLVSTRIGTSETPEIVFPFLMGTTLLGNWTIFMLETT